MSTFVSETIEPLEGGFDAARMAMGEPGVPRFFRWRKEVWEVVQVLDGARQFGDCAHGSGERYVRRHVYRCRMAHGPVFRLAFQRSFGRGHFARKGRWRLVEIEK
jgi:phosphoribosylglycinamide formyltransferase-1